MPVTIGDVEELFRLDLVERGVVDPEVYRRNFTRYIRDVDWRKLVDKMNTEELNTVIYLGANYGTSNSRTDG